MTDRFYDPLGIIQPVIVTFKIFIQELCRVGITWDEPLQGDLLERWQLLVESLCGCQPITIPRYYASSFDCIDSFQLCGFCDASNSTYAAVIFINEKRRRVDHKNCGVQEQSITIETPDHTTFRVNGSITFSWWPLKRNDSIRVKRTHAGWALEEKMITTLQSYL